MALHLVALPAQECVWSTCFCVLLSFVRLCLHKEVIGLFFVDVSGSAAEVVPNVHMEVNLWLRAEEGGPLVCFWQMHRVQWLRRANGHLLLMNWES